MDTNLISAVSLGKEMYLIRIRSDPHSFGSANIRYQHVIQVMFPVPVPEVYNERKSLIQPKKFLSFFLRVFKFDPKKVDNI